MKISGLLMLLTNKLQLLYKVNSSIMIGKV